MNERTPATKLDDPSADPKLDLSDLSATSRPAPKVVGPSHAVPLETDLSKISIATSSVPRVSTKPEKRRELEDLYKPRELRPAPQRPRIDRSRHGILRNPYFRYRGGPVIRFITLLANLLKFLEQLILGKLAGPKLPPQRQAKPVTPPQQLENDPTRLAEKRRREALERAEKSALRTHRS
jgi:hypothetical protein